MARLLTDPCEQAATGWYSHNGGFSISNDGRTGGCYLADWGTEVSRSWGAAVSGVGFQGAIKVSNADAWGSYYTLGTQAGTRDKVRVQVESNAIKVYVLGSLVLTYSTMNALHTWYTLGLLVDVDTDTLELYLNGAQVGSYGGDLSGVGTMDAVSVRADGSINDFVCFDDIAINSLVGSDNTGVPAAVKLMALQPNSTTSNVGWIGSDGDSTDNHEMINGSVASSYIESTTSGDSITVGVDTFTLPANTQLLQVHSLAAGEDGQGLTSEATLSITTDGTAGASLAKELNPTGSAWGVAYPLAPDGLAWTPAKVNATTLTLENTTP